MEDAPRRPGPVPLVAMLAVLVVALGLLPTVPPASAEPEAAPAQGEVPRARAPWTPYTGITFNWPVGTRAERTVIARRINAAIDHTPRGETIRIATYNLGLKASADKLIRAHRRGVRVQVIVNANLVGRLEARVQRAIGKNPARTSFLYVCKRACRNSSPGGNMHLKIYSFTRTGTARRLFISSSANLAGPAVHGQWNDSVAIAGNDGLFTAWWKLFDEMRRDRAASPRRVTFSSEEVTAFFQRPGTSTPGRTTVGRAVTDAPYRRLQDVGCRAPEGFGNAAGRSVITVNMRAWYARRGERLAGLLARKKGNGCQVRVIGSLMSKEVVRILKRAGIPVRSADWDWGPRTSTSDPDKIVYGPSCYSHLKYVTVNGSYRGRGDRLVWTGSENWSPPGLGSDEVTLELHGALVTREYDRMFMRMWKSPRATHRVGPEPTSRPCA
ncbi:phosphatidylserine/phosphatidylglycerophosphate/cardiolipin synthase family protein [Nocardioides sp. J9]|uniref:phospholipase D-like domain-containing protein n=1 Tax=Nocardioides sp. J9 TaxID=935844 RepID=UPI0011A29E0C|nr:phospholipase D-like domain-containing protein [Nocardioides sp. J9]